MAIADSRFHPRNSGRKKLAIWFAFFGDASVRDICRRTMADVDDERLSATVATPAAMSAEAGPVTRDPMETALGMEAPYDGIRLNIQLSPNDFKGLSCRQMVLDHIEAVFPQLFSSCAQACESLPRNLLNQDERP